jgi:hypothetical protein
MQSDRRHEQERELKRAAAVVEMHKRKGIPYDPAQDGFVFSSAQIEAFCQRMVRINESRHTEQVLFGIPMRLATSANYGG